jgi:hypothetical protein
MGNEIEGTELKEKWEGVGEVKCGSSGHSHHTRLSRKEKGPKGLRTGFPIPCPDCVSDAFRGICLSCAGASTLKTR